MYARKAYAIRMQAGDPGFFGKLWKGVKKAAKFVVPVAALANSKQGLAIGSQVLPGIGPIAGKFGSRFIGGALGGGASRAGGELLRRAAAAGGTAILNRAAGRLLNRGGGGMSVAPDFGGVSSGSSSTAPSPRPGTMVFDPVTGTWRRKKYRRMNVTNMRALTRATRRVKGFAKIARACFTLDKRVKVKKGGRGRCR